MRLNDKLNMTIESTSGTRLRRIALAAAALTSSVVGLASVGTDQASATTSGVSTSFYGTCVGGAFGASNIYCLPSRLTATGVSEFQSKLTNDTNSQSCFSNISMVDSAGFYLSGSTWHEGSGGDHELAPSVYGVTENYAASVASGTQEQIATQFCTLEFSATY
jgi:hypothetical protein